MSQFQAFAIALNNRAVTLIGNGNYKGAIASLVEALQASKHTVQYVNDEDEKAPLMGMDAYMNYSELAAGNGSVDEHKDRCIYKQPIHIADSIPLCHESCVMVSTSIIFNLALSHHLHALYNPVTQRDQRKVAQLYEQAFTLQREIKPSLLFTMIIFNNLGFVYQALNDAVTSDKCFKHLLSTLMYAIDCGQAKESNFQSFFHNTLHLILNQSATAAAA